MAAPIYTLVRAADGTGLAVTETGRSEPVLFVAGLGYASWSWMRQVAALGARFRVITVDNRGTGASDKPPGPYSIELLAEDIATVIRHMGSYGVHVVGASMGGYIALTLARAHPQLVRSLTLIATSAGGPTATPVPEATKLAWARAANSSPESFARATMPLAFRPGWWERHVDAAEQLLRLRLAAPTPPAAWRAQFEACEQYLSKGLPAGAVPHRTLVVHGTADRVVPYDNAEQLLSRIPHARLARLDGAGHLCWIEEAERVNHLIAEHVAAGS